MPVLLGHFGSSGGDAGGIGDFELERDGLDAVLGERLHRSGTTSEIAGTDEDGNALLAKLASGFEAEALVGAGDESDAGRRHGVFP
jgi:hypothetical protein